MRQRSMAVMLVSATLIPTSLSAQRTPNPERTAVQSIITAFAEHIQSGNFSAIDSLFPARGVHILTDDATTHGWPEYRDGYLRPELASFQELQYAHTAVEAVVRENVAWVAFRRQLTGQDATTPAVNGRGTAVLEKRQGRWIIVHLHMSR